MSMYNEINIQHFANLVKELKIDLLTQEEFNNAVEELYMAIFRHNTKGEYVIETMPNDKTNWIVYKHSQTVDKALKIIKELK